MIGLGSDKNLLDKNENAGRLCVWLLVKSRGKDSVAIWARQRQAIAGGQVD